MITEPIAVTLKMTNALEALGVRYFIGGSLATAVHGVARATMDVDVVADLHPEHVESLVRILGDAFYADPEMMRSAIRHQSSFNVIHQETMFKVDIFIPKKRPFDQVQFERRVLQSLTGDPEHKVYIASPEDNILAKLEWYRMGGEVSDRQWQDVLNVLKVQGDRLDMDYLGHWAVQLEVADLLRRVLGEM